MDTDQLRRNVLFGHPPGGTLPRSVFSLCLLIIAPVWLVSCSGEPGGGEEKERVRVALLPQAAGRSIRSLDLFIYSNEGTRRLEAYCHCTEPHGEPFLLEVPPGEKTAVALANSPWAFRLDALAAFDSMELLQMRYELEDAAAPFLSGAAEFCAGLEEGAPVGIFLQPLLCAVELCSVFCDCPGEVLLEEPVVQLEQVNAAAEVLRRDGFRPVELVDAAAQLRSPQLMRAALPCDVGRYTQYPRTTLACYPNDAASPTAGTPRTRLVLQGRLSGQFCRWETVLPPVRRGCRIKTRWTLTGAGRCLVETQEEKDM